MCHIKATLKEDEGKSLGPLYPQPSLSQVCDENVYHRLTPQYLRNLGPCSPDFTIFQVQPKPETRHTLTPQYNLGNSVIVTTCLSLNTHTSG